MPNFRLLILMVLGLLLAVDCDPLVAAEATYHSRISRIFQQHCISCHRDGGAAPFALDTYSDVVARARIIRNVIERRVMPPWYASRDQRGMFANDASLSGAERAELISWLSGAMEEGDPTGTRTVQRVDEEWMIGEPDVIYEFPEPIPVPARGVMPYQYVTIDTGVPQEQWVQAVEIRPGDISVVHHVLVFAVPPGKLLNEIVNYWAGYVPGRGARSYRAGVARRLPRGARLVFQMHYTPNGTATRDRTRIGLRFADSPPQYEAKTASVINTRFTIPAGAQNFRVAAGLRVPRDIMLLGYMPHHHLRGMAGRYELVAGNRQPEVLLEVPEYDFNWQLFYELAEPRPLRRGARIRYTAWYDNSAANPANPNPNRPVSWGLQTNDEMHVGYIEYAIPRS